MTTALSLWAPLAYLDCGWAEDVLFRVDDGGMISTVEFGIPPGNLTRLPGVVIPGMPNLHSHAFQRAMAGLTERPGGTSTDDFWTWRKTMYGFVERLMPDQVEAIAAQSYVEMLKAGYTSIAEFHYLHNPVGGGRYHDPAELARRVAAGAAAAGIRLSLMPVLYQDGGFGGEALDDVQQRFRLEIDEWALIIAAMARTGVSERSSAAALHSLRAVSPAALDEAVAAYGEIRADGPIHIHIAEQEKEVSDCLAWSGQRPVEWLLDHAPVDRRWTLVHATHMTESERLGVAGVGAVAGVCPTTEANLGDGIFELPSWLAAGGAWGIGSDSNVSLDPCEEIRWLEYVQRLTLRRRLTSHPGIPTESLGQGLWLGAVEGGARALGQPCGRLEAGRAADFLVLDPEHPTLAGHAPETVLDAWVFSNAGSALTEVWVAGRPVIRDGRHAQEDAIAHRYRAALTTLMESL